MSALTQDELVEALERATKRIDALEAVLRIANEELILVADDALDPIGERIDSVRAGIKDALAS